LWKEEEGEEGGRRWEGGKEGRREGGKEGRREGEEREGGMEGRRGGGRREGGKERRGQKVNEEETRKDTKFKGKPVTSGQLGDCFIRGSQRSQA
jgi:hypothetical protein